MKTAVVFYSLDGNCALIAQVVKNQLNADMLHLQLTDKKKRGKAGKMFWGCGMVFSGKKPPLESYVFDPAAYDLIIIGSPVWAGSPAPPVKTFLSQTVISGKKIALFVCHGGGKGRSLEKFKAMLPGNEIAGEADFIVPSKAAGEEVQRQVAEWLHTLGKC